MTKRQALTRYAGVVVAVLLTALVIDGALDALHAEAAAWILDVIVLSALVLWTWGSFAPNSPIFGRVIDGAGVTDPVVAVTFDDGPSPDTTPRILAALRAEGVRATFFVLGKHAERHPEVVEQIVRDGHELASHGWTHGILLFARRRDVVRELLPTQALLDRVGGPPVRLFRAPHGFRSPFVAPAARSLGYRVVGWTKGVFDTALPGADVIVERSAKALRPGAILLLHDADGSGDGDRSQTAEAMPGIIAAIRERGLEPVTVSELAALQPIRSISWRRIALVIAAVALVVTIAFMRLNRNQVGQAWSTLLALNLLFVFASLFSNFLSVVFKATVWKAVLDTIPSVPRAGYGMLLPAIFIGFLLNTVLPARLGELGRIVVLRRSYRRKQGVDVPSPTIAGSLVMEQLFLGATLAMLLAVMAATFSGVPGWASTWIGILGAVLLGLLVGVVALELWTRARRGRDGAIEEVLGRAEPTRTWWARLLARVEQTAHAINRGNAVLRDPRRVAIGLAAGLVSWGFQVLGIYWALKAFGIDQTLAAAAVVFLVSNLVGIFPILPGNVGVFQVAVVASLTGAFNVDPATATAFAIVLQVLEVALGSGIGLIFLSREGLSIGELRRDIREAEADMEEGAPPIPLVVAEQERGAVRRV